MGCILAGIVKPGVKCRVIARIDSENGDQVCYDGKSPNHGKVVMVERWMAEHHKVGNVWRCSGIDGEQLITYWGIVSLYADFAESCLEPLPPEPLGEVLREEAILGAM